MCLGTCDSPLRASHLTPTVNLQRQTFKVKKSETTSNTQKYLNGTVCAGLLFQFRPDGLIDTTRGHDQFYCCRPRYSYDDTNPRCIIWIMSHTQSLKATCRPSQWSEGGAVGPGLPTDAAAPQIQIDNAYCITFRHDRFNCESNREIIIYSEDRWEGNTV